VREKKVIKFVDLPSQYADVEQRIIQGVVDLIHRGEFVGGEPLSRFENSLAAFCGTRYAVGCSDGTLALVIALKASGLKEGEGVVVPVNSYIASANAVVHAGGVPVFVDCDPDTYLIDLNATEAALRKKKAAFIMPVHLYGNPCPMKAILALANRHGARVIEDNAQAIGARLGTKRTGSFGIAAGISFYPAKNLGAFGQGGAIVTDDEKVAKLARAYTDQGQAGQKYFHEVIGYNGRLDSIQAEVLSILLGKVDAFNRARLALADEYASRLPGDSLQKRTEGSFPVYHLFEYRCDSRADRDGLAEALRNSGVQTGLHYPVPIHKQKAYADQNGDSFPVAERLSDRLISLPMHPSPKKAEVEIVCGLISNYERTR
jgi:dTDP-4-amino-4,6-dideoxygalactose transaminase